MATTPATLRPVEFGGNGYRHGHGRSGGSRIIVAGTAHGDGRDGRLGWLLESLGLGRVRVERGLGVFSLVASSLAPATPGALGAPTAAALVAHHRDSFARRVFAVIGVGWRVSQRG